MIFCTASLMLTCSMAPTTVPQFEHRMRLTANVARSGVLMTSSNFVFAHFGQEDIAIASPFS
jgi:hypothetical protein